MVASIAKDFLIDSTSSIGQNAFGTVQSTKNRISFPVSWGVRFPMDWQFTRFLVDGLVES